VKLKYRVPIKKELPSLFIGLSLTFIGLVFLYQLWNFNPRVPILYSGDGLLTLNGLRNMRFGNWYWSTQNLGAPFGQDLHDFPAVAENLHLIILWLGLKILRSEVLTFNLFFFGTYFFTTTFGYIGSRIIRLNRSTAVLVGVIYSFLPFHFQHGPGHLYLAAYWALPIWIAFLIRELMGDSISPFTQGSKLDWFCRPSTFLIAAISIVAATTGLYYSFFFIILAASVLCIRRLKQLSSFEWVPTLFSIVVACAVMAIQYFPVWLYQRQNGSNLSIVKRSISEVEYYSLKIVNLILPINGHRISFFNEIRAKANPVYLIGEGADALGLFGSVGLITLLVVLILQTTSERNKLFSALSVFTIIALLISTVGGFTQVIAAFGFTQLRVGSRMSVVIAFPAIVSAAICLEKLLRNRKRGVVLVSLLIIGSLSVLDMNPGNQLPPYKAVAQSWERDRDVVTRVSTGFGNDAMIFQLPIVPFPENPPVVDMTDYEHLKGYLHSPSLRWSYGGVKGRSADWQLSLPTDPKILISKLRQQNFQVIWINRNGYEDRGTLLFNQLKDLGLKLFFRDANLFILDLRESAN
jgi:phosphoglycerol transferase